MRAAFCLSLSVGLLTASVVWSADNPAGTFTDAKEAGPDYVVQGEYAGEKGPGVQVIALGDGKFDGVVYAGGLPGAGWDGKTKEKLAGATEGAATTLKGEGLEARISDGKLTLTKGAEKTELKKVERTSPTLGAKPPEGAKVLFDGKSVDGWVNGKLHGDLLGIGTRTKDKFSSYKLHLEFQTPFMPKARGQGRGNSGMYLNDQYECQILDSFGLTGENNECGGIYTVAKPLVNMCLPPLAWQTYDVEFTAAKFADGKKTAPAKLKLLHNGVVIHDTELAKNTPGGMESDEAKPGALFLQDHGNPVRFRNIWIVETK